MHPAYDEARYVRSVGVARSADPLQARRQADLNAFAGLAEQIRVLVTSESVSADSEERSGATLSGQTLVAEVVQSFAQESLSALRVVERYSDADTAWSLAVLERAVALGELTRLLGEARIAVGAARAAREAAFKVGRAKAAFAALRDEYAAALRSVELVRTASALQRGPGANRLEALSPGAVLVEAQRLLEHLELKKLGGEAQELHPGAPARFPLSVQALLDGVPLQGLLLRASPSAGAIDVETPPPTDAEGRSDFGIPLVGRDPLGSYALSVRVDLSGLRDGADPAWDDVFAGEPTVVFSFGHAARRALRLELRGASEFMRLLREQLSGRGYALADSDADLVVEGEARVDPAGPTQIGTSARCLGELRVLRAGELIGRVPFLASGIGVTEAEALSRALRAGARDAAEKLPQALR